MHMKRVSSYLKMRVLGAIESAPGSTNVARIRHVSEQVFLDEDEQRLQFTWRTIQTWYSRLQERRHHHREAQISLRQGQDAQGDA